MFQIAQLVCKFYVERGEFVHFQPHLHVEQFGIQCKMDVSADLLCLWDAAFIIPLPFTH